METTLIQRQYDEVIADHYDLDPQNITSDSLDHALEHLCEVSLLNPALPPLRVLDLGMGTGMFLSRMLARSYRAITPFGVDLSANMARLATEKIPELQTRVDDAANFDNHFPGQTFDLICTHFVTGFVPIEHLAPRIFDRLEPGGYWSFVGCSKMAYPGLRSKAESPLVRMLFGGGKLLLDDMICPTNENALRDQLTSSGFETVNADTFEPRLEFQNFSAFMEYAYTGGWLTPFIEELGLHKTGRTTKALLNSFVFPVTDHHSILLALARKPAAAE